MITELAGMELVGVGFWDVHTQSCLISDMPGDNTAITMVVYFV